MGWSRFEDLVAWQKARVLTRRIYEMTSSGLFARDFGLAGQIQSASVSVMSNIAEGFARKSRLEFQRFLLIAKGSVAEVSSQLYVALDAGFISEIEFQELYDLAQEVSRIIEGLRSEVVRQARLGKPTLTSPL